MTAGNELLEVEGLGSPPDGSLVEESRQALSRINDDLRQKLNAIDALSAPATVDIAKWQDLKEAMESQTKTEAEKESLLHKTVIQLHDLHQFYDGLLVAGKSLSGTPKSNIKPDEEKKSPAQETEKRIGAAVQQVKSSMASTVLDLSGLMLHSLPETLQKLSSSVVKLDLSNNNLETLPEAVASLVNLASLDLHSNQLTSLPDSIGRLVKLKVLNISGNMLAALPDGIEACCAMEELIADFNQLTRLPEGLGFELVNLQRLSVHSNRLNRLPYSTSHMMRLRVLDVHLNHLGSLPTDMENLTNLEILNLSQNFNYLLSLPDSIGGLSALVELDISYNHIKMLPNSIARLENLQRLKVEGNPLIEPPPSVVEHSVEAVKEYLGEKMKMPSRKGKKSSWLGHLMPTKWGRRGAASGMKNNSRVLSLNEENDLSSARPGHDLLTPLRLFTPGRTSSPFRAFATPLRPKRKTYAAI
ncbi:hypothetical protein SUGI_0527090 [Cryptomeria japonica]|uniref:plant intracellular Ras-group-related LRR protein 1 n=1 Tax=Cryptomeria japonica TaxID=3369 RepID=UPI002408A5C5|nr:plant intracellular Ras-group-related LRR protein 1 [Cryptomeria japonica]XP_057859976.2 plant intracellular Ras-group-related LRR protein 1 [Cryptomeria japonica]GLJ26929.1 hypothetical protein SUGI_0527090 [Cryptomeria japonica]